MDESQLNDTDPVRQVLLLLLAAEVTLSHRPKDADVVKKAASAAQKRYKEMSGRETKVSFEAKLPDESAGGVVGSTMAGRIRVDNTLEERLKILQEKASHLKPFHFHDTTKESPAIQWCHDLRRGRD